MMRLLFSLLAFPLGTMRPHFTYVEEDLKPLEGTTGVVGMTSASGRPSIGIILVGMSSSKSSGSSSSTSSSDR